MLILAVRMFPYARCALPIVVFQRGRSEIGRAYSCLERPEALDDLELTRLG